MIKWIILSGLPASGKTFWATNFKRIYDLLTPESEDDGFCRIISVDEIIKKTGKELDLSNVGYYYLSTDTYVILDGLFLTNNSIIKTVSTIPKKYIDSVTVVHWKENRDNCHINDIARRDNPSSHSIDTLPLEHPDAILIKERIGIDVSVRIKEVGQHPIKLDCHGCIISPIYETKDEQDIQRNISEFKELNILLKQKYPYLTYQEYMNIVKPLIKVKTLESDDYYSGRSITYWYSINYNKLCQALDTVDRIPEIIDDVLSRYYNKCDDTYSYIRYDKDEKEFQFESELKDELQKNNLSASINFTYGINLPSLSSDFCSVSWVYKGQIHLKNIHFIMY